MAENVGMFIQAQRGIFLVMMVVLALLFFVCLVRAVMGPRVADRLVAVNMVGTMVMVMIAVLSMYLGEDYLLDICLIYAMVSFLAVIVLTKVYIGIYEEQHPEPEDMGGEYPSAAEGKLRNMTEDRGGEKALSAVGAKAQDMAADGNAAAGRKPQDAAGQYAADGAVQRKEVGV
ncbi:MAG: cation:proton antiporter [Butyrivibrio sp.]|nr:cation:proton antiporter [Muribaculum sp.]MCM1553411.1 cation:proton antiporter [Butyrivibrio sp.]